MAVILPPRGGAGSNLGASLGGGLGDILQSLGTGIQQRKQSRRLEEAGLPGILAQLDPQVQAAYLREYGAAQKQAEAQEMERQRQNFIDQIKSGFEPQAQPEGIPGQEQVSAQEGIATPEGTETVRETETFKPKMPKTREARLAQENANLEKALQNPRLSASQRSQISAAIEDNEERLQKVRESRIKEFGKELGQLREDYLVAKELKSDLNRIKELEEEGLTSQKLEAFFEGSGIDIPALRNPGSEEFNKIIANQTRNIKKYFGGRISNLEVEKFLETLPSLLNSPEGRKRIIAQLDRVNNMKVASYDVAKKIIKENEGIAPNDLWERVDEKLEKKRDKITDQFKEDLKRPVPESESRLGVAASYGLGKAAPVAGGAALGAGIGALLGGPAGAGIGAGAGAAGPLISRLLSMLGGR